MTSDAHAPACAPDAAPGDRDGKRKFGGGTGGGGGRKNRRRDDPFGAAAVAKRAVDAACQRDDFDAAWKTFEDAEVKDGEFALAPHACNVLLHMCLSLIHISEPTRPY